MKQLLLFILIQSFLFAQNLDTNSSDTLSNDVVVIEDSFGLSEDEIREVAQETDTYKKTKKISISEVIEAVDEQGKVDVSKLQSLWENLSPTPKNMIGFKLNLESGSKVT